MFKIDQSNKPDEVTEILAEVKAMYAARGEQKTAAEEEVSRLAGEISTLMQKRESVLEAGDADALVQIDDKLRHLRAQQEVAAHKAKRAPFGDTKIIQDMIDRLVKAVKQSDEAAGEEIIQLRDNARDIVVDATRTRMNAGHAMQMLREMIRPGENVECKLPETSGAIVSGKQIAGVYIHQVDHKTNPGSWKQGLDI